MKLSDLAFKQVFNQCSPTIITVDQKILFLALKLFVRVNELKQEREELKKIILNLGRLNNQTFSSFVDSYISTVVTKFGVCSIKVLISYNKVERRF
jgi:hypothetical protein